MSSDSELTPLGSLGIPDIDSIAQAYYTARMHYYGEMDVDLHLVPRVQKATAQIRQVHETIRKQIRASEQRHKAAEKQTPALHLKLRRARLQLDSVRRSIIIESSAIQTEEPESFVGDEAMVTQPQSHNPYAQFLVSRAATLDVPAEELPKYFPRSQNYSDLEVS